MLALRPVDLPDTSVYIKCVVRVAIVGSRNYKDLSEVREYVLSLPQGTVIITGGANGVDSVAAAAAEDAGLKVVVHAAEWALYGKAAGPIRNRKIVEDCDKLVAFWDDESPGTKNSISLASKAGKLEKVFRCNKPRQGTLF